MDWLRGPGRAVLVGVAILGSAGVPARSDTEPSFEYVRDVKTIHGVVGSVLARARTRDEAVLFVFDTATFDPPPGRSEFNDEHPFAEDLPKWMSAIREKCAGAAAGDDRSVRVAATTSRRILGLGEDAWEEALAGDLRRRGWDGSGGFEPADRALSRLLLQMPGGRRVVALVTGDVAPEKWVRRPPFGSGRLEFGPDGVADPGPGGGPEPWRSHLSDVGEYWDPERVGAAVAGANARLVVVAPEARFGDFLPLEDLPQAPWAERPLALTDPVPGPAPAAGTGAPGARGGGLTEEQVRRFEERMRTDGFSEQDIRAQSELLRRRRSGDTLLRGRFTSRTARWFPDWGQIQKPFNTDVPSSYGHWPLARAAARTGGAYYFYPFPPAPWADVCPRDAALVDAMAPELVPVPQFAALRKGDEALSAMLEAQEIVFAPWLWSDSSTGLGASGGASSWCGFDARGNAPAARWRPREKPYDEPAFGAVGFRSGKGVAERLREAAADYDRALRILVRAEERLAAGRLSGTCRRSEANLRLCRFWFEASAFHVDALAIFMAEMERFLPPGGRRDELVITWWPAFKLSDCLDAYDGRTISAEDEIRYGHRGGGFLEAPPGHQGNFLNVTASDPNFRAKRDLDQVLRNLDPRLRPRAQRVIDAARDVMAREARTAWGWVTYYSEVHTYVWVKTPTGVPRRRSGDPDDDPDPVRTPGSGGEGPATK